MKKRTTRAQTPTESEHVTVAPREERSSNAPDIAGAFVLITIGLIFLLNNLGILSWDIWGELWKFWPIFLVLAGLEMVFGKRWLGRLVVGTISLLLLAFILVYSISVGINQERQQQLRERFPWWPQFQVITGEGTQTREWRVQKSEFGSFEYKKMDIDFGNGTIMIADQAEMPEILLVKADYSPKRHLPKVDSELQGTTLYTKIASDSIPFIGFNLAPVTYDVRLSEPSKPLELDLAVGSGEASVSFNSQKVTKLTTRVGSGSATLRLSDQSIPQQKVVMDIGSGDATIHLPANVRVRVNYTIGSGELNTNGNSYDGTGQFVSDNIADTLPIFDLELRIGSGQATLNQE